MLFFQKILNRIREIPSNRLKLLGIITGGHSVMHWYMESFAVTLPTVKLGLKLNDVQIGTLMSVRQVTSGTVNFPVGMLADSLVNYRHLLLASAPIVMGIAYMLLGLSYSFAWTILAVGMIGFAIALWHPTALATLSNRFPEHRATVIALHGMGGSISNAITPLGIGYFLEMYFFLVQIFLEILYLVPLFVLYELNHSLYRFQKKYY